MSELMGATVKGPGLKPAESMGVIRGAEAPRSLREAIECVPQRLKPDSLGYACGTAEAVPLSKTRTFRGEPSPRWRFKSFSSPWP